MCSDYSQYLESAVLNEDLQKVKLYLSKEADPKTLIFTSISAKGKSLHNANDVNIVRELLSHGAPVDYRNFYGDTPLFTAVKQRKSVKIIQELLRHGADANAKIRRNDTPLNVAVRKRNPNIKVIQELLEYDADINIHNYFEYRFSPLDNALASYTEAAKMIIQMTVLKYIDRNFKEILCLNRSRPSRPRFSPELFLFTNDCESEVVKMKSEMLKGNFSLYDFAIMKGLTVALRTNNDNVKTDIALKSRYPIYFKIIWPKIKYSLRRVELLNEVSKLEIYGRIIRPKENMSRKIVFDYSVAHNILKYLNNGELINVGKAYEKINLLNELTI